MTTEPRRGDAGLRVLFATGLSHLPQRVGGSQSSTHDLCEALQRRGIVTAVLAALDPGGALAIRNRIVRKLTRRRFPADRTMGYAVYRGWTPPRGVPEVVAAFGPDVAVVQAGRPVPLVRELIAQDVPTVFYLRDVSFERMGGDMPTDGRVRYVANSRFTADRLHAHAGLRADVIPPLVNPERYRTSSTRDVVLYICPHPVKGAELAFQIAESRPDVPFLFQESWSLREDLRQTWLERARVAGNIEWQEPVEDMRPVYGRARLVLAPSLAEPWGRIATEAQVSGIPLLASDRGGLPEAVGPGGILADPEGPLLPWLEGLSTLWDDEPAYRSYSEAAQRHAQRNEIQPETLISRLLGLLEAHARRTPGASLAEERDPGSPSGPLR